MIKGRLNKKGYMLSLEAIIGVLILFLFFYYVAPQKVPATEPKNIELIQNAILNEVATNLALRNAVLASQMDYQPIRDAIDAFLKNRYNYYFVIKNTDEFPSSVDLSVPPKNKQVYAKSIVISATSDNIGPKAFYLYLWEK